MKKFYITTAIPYVNAKPHIGHALEYVQTDAITRYHKLCSEEVLMLCGGDENALKNVQAAEKAGLPVQEFIDTNTEAFLSLTKQLNVHYDVWQKSTDVKTHHVSSQKLWELCAQNGDIYKKQYEGLYCVGCETFYTQDELNENGECFEHPGKKLEKVAEENYFFKLSGYQDQLIKLISSDELKIFPETRKNEMLGFLKQPLQDISISRSNARAKNFGVPVPGDDSQRIYVWFDGLNIYQSGVGFGWDDEKYKKWWPADVHLIGKGITRFHAIYWPAFLLSAGLALPKSLFVHGYFTIDGQKMSKTLGNIIDPLDIIKKYGIDPLRYYVLREIPAYDDGDFSEKRLIEVYNADLAHGLGNLVARTAALCKGLKFEASAWDNLDFPESYHQKMSEFRFDEVLADIWKEIRDTDKYLNEKEPWKLKQEPDALLNVMKEVVNRIRSIGFQLQPFMPETAESIIEQFKGEHIESREPYFAKLETKEEARSIED